MWAIDRLSTNSTPQPSLPNSRPYSPAPRRSNLGPGRPYLPHRDSSISLASPSASNSNLPGSSRFPPRSSSRTVPPPDVEDPFVALERIVGQVSKSAGSPHEAEGVPEKPSILDADIAFDGLSLQEYVACETTSDETSAAPQYSHHSVEEYEKEREKFEDLHKSITGCDDVLESVEKYLASFQTDLASVAAEIETLQSRSTSLNDKLENRKKVERLLGPTVDRIFIPPHVVKKVSEGPVDEAFIQSLEELQKRAKALSSANELRDVKAVQDLNPLIENLENSAVERIRDYFATQIRALRSPNINAQILQQQRFLRFQPLYAFLATKQPQLAAEIMQAYSNTMRWYHESLFTRYYTALTRLKLYTTDRHDILGEDPVAAAKSRGTFSAPKTDTFSLARRTDILKASAATAMPSHAAEESKSAHHIETPFMALNLTLIDNASFEYSFLNSFFSARSTITKATTTTIDHATISRQFNIIFSPITALATNLTKDLITESYDALGVLLLIRLTQHFAFVLQRRKVPALDTYVNGTNMLLWPRFQSLLDANCTSLRQLTSSLPTRQSGASNAAGTIAGFSSSGGGNAGGSTAPHPVTQRFANFAKGIIDLSSEAGDDEPVSNSLARLRGEYESFLSKLGGSFGSGDKGRKEKKKLLANNYTLILAVLADAKGRLGQETRARFEELQEENS